MGVTVSWGPLSQHTIKCMVWHCSILPLLQLPHVMDKIQVKHSHQSMLQDRRPGLAKTMQFYSLFIFVVQRPGSSPFDACHKDQSAPDYCHEISKPTEACISSLCQSPRWTMYKQQRDLLKGRKKPAPIATLNPPIIGCQLEDLALITATTWKGLFCLSWYI